MRIKILIFGTEPLFPGRNVVLQTWVKVTLVIRPGPPASKRVQCRGELLAPLAWLIFLNYVRIAIPMF